MAIDPKLAKVVAKWKHDAPLTACRMDAQAKYVFTGHEDNLVARFSLNDGTRTVFKGGHETWVRGLATCPDGKLVVSGGADGKLSWWESDGTGDKPVRTLQAHQGWIRTVDIDPAGTFVATGGNDNRVCLWDLKTGELRQDIQSHQRHIYNVTFHPDSKSLFSGDLMGRLIQTDVATGKELSTLDAKDLHTYHKGQKTDFGGIRGVSINPEKKLVAAGGTYKGTNPFGAIHEPLVLLFDQSSGKLTRKLLAPGIKRGVIWRLRWLTSEILCGVCGGGDGGFLLFWKPDSEKDFHRLKLPNLARDMDWNPKSEMIATAHYDRHVRLTGFSADPEGQSSKK